MFGRATIRLGIGPHSSLVCKLLKYLPLQTKLILLHCSFSLLLDPYVHAKPQVWPAIQQLLTFNFCTIHTHSCTSHTAVSRWFYCATHVKGLLICYDPISVRLSDTRQCSVDITDRSIMH